MTWWQRILQALLALAGYDVAAIEKVEGLERELKAAGDRVIELEARLRESRQEADRWRTHALESLPTGTRLDAAVDLARRKLSGLQAEPAAVPAVAPVPPKRRPSDPS